MKYPIPLILYFLMCNIIYAQHISKFSSLIGGTQDPIFHLPSTHTFQYIIKNGDDLDDGGQMPHNLDFAGFVSRKGSSKYGFLSINSEAAPGGVVILDLEFDDVKGKWEVDNKQAVDFNLLFPTAANCSGTVTPWNTIISCEEYTSIELEQNPKYGFPKDINGDGYHDLGWAVEINPETKKIINQNGGRDDKDKLWAMGNFKHENAVVHSNLKTVYQGADDTKGQGYLFKFVAHNPKDLSSGDLFVYSGDKQNSHKWEKLKNSSQWEQNNTLMQCDSLKNLQPSKAKSFGGIEDVEISPIDGFIYFAVKKESNDQFSGNGVVYRFRDIDPLNDTGIDDFEIYAGGNSIYDGVEWGYGNDNLVFDDLGNLWVTQDGDDNHIWVIDQGHTQSNPKVRIFARTPVGSEPTGLTFSPDYRYIFMSIQHPSSGNNIGQTDALGKLVTFDKDVTLVIARNEHLGKDLTMEDQEIMISQYYHDDETNSKWIEIKNISGHDIPAGSYFIDLYDSAILADIASSPPKASEAISAMLKDEVLLYKNSSSPALPQTEYIGGATQISSSICDFDGNDVILITTTPGSRKYNNRKDILGYSPANTWGQNTSLIRGGNSLELPERDFDAVNWIETDSLEEVSKADKYRNIALGTQVTGPTSWDGTRWDNLKPDRSRIVNLGSVYDASEGSIEAYNLTLETDVTVDFNHVGTNNSIIVHNDLNIIGSLIIGDTESLIIKSSSASVSGEIEKIEKSSPRNHKNDITYWSSPVEDEEIESVFKGVNANRIFYFDQTKHLDNNPSSETYWDVWQPATGTMEVTKGYAAEGIQESSEIHKTSFKGKPNFGIIESSVLDFHDDSNDENDYNLLGNPYPAAIDIKAFLEENISVVDGTAYFWNHASGLIDGAYSRDDYVTYNLFGSVPKIEKKTGSAQGFFVRALKDEPVIFDPSMILVNANHQFFKRSAQKNSEKKDRMWLNLKGSDNSFKQLLIGFTESATDAMDNGYDAIYLDGGSQLGFYSLLDERKLVIQGLGSFEASKKIDLGLDVKSEGLNLIIEIDRVEGVLSDVEVILIDYEKGVMHDLKQNGYQFDYNSKGSFLDRFSITFNSTILSTEELDEASKLHMYIKDEELFVDAPEKINEIKIFDVLGRLVISNKPSSKMFQLSLNKISSGSFFIVKATGENMQNLTRKMIKY